jgi:hypothetical protein
LPCDQRSPDLSLTFCSSKWAKDWKKREKNIQTESLKAKGILKDKEIETEDFFLITDIL